MNKGIKDLRITFDADPALYDRIRPHYPSALFDVLLHAVRPSAAPKLLEIGLGTGQATEPFAERGYDITALDIGEKMVKFAQEKLSRYNNVHVIHSSFEDAQLPHESFDLIYSATAFHWIDQDVKYIKSHELLKDAGHLAVIGTQHVSDGHGDAFFFATQPLYKEYQPSRNNEGYQLLSETDVAPEVFDQNLFKLVAFEKFSVAVTYNSETYCQLLSTFSDVLQMPDAARKTFLDKIAKLIREHFNDQIVKHSVMTLSIAQKQ